MDKTNAEGLAEVIAEMRERAKSLLANGPHAISEELKSYADRLSAIAAGMGEGDVADDADSLSGGEYAEAHEQRMARAYCTDASPAPKPAGLSDEARALVQLAEGPGCVRWQDASGFRLKDTPEWSAFYVAVKSLTGATP